MTIPTLRFKADDSSKFGEWKSIQLKDIAERIARKNKEENQNALTISAQMGLVNQQAYFSKQIASRDLSKYYLLHKGEYAYNKSYSAGYPMGAIKRLKLYEKGVVSTLYICFSLNKQVNSDFFEQYVESGNLVPELEKIAQEGARNHGLLNISLQEFFEINLIVPCLKEQMKIATFLSAVDEKISQLSQKLHLLGQYKQGMMQKLFSQQIRFKADDGSEFGEWDEYSLDTLLSKIIDNRGKTPVTEANLEIPLIEVNAIGQRRIKYEKVSKYFSEDTFQNWFRAYLEHQDILFSTVGNTAICSIYTDEIKAGIAQNIVGLRANIKLIQPTFLYYLLTEISNNQKFKSIEMQAVQPSIKVSQMIHLTFLTPCLEEQSKIANFLSSIDQKIEVVAQQIEQAKLWKKGLLQQMFV